MTKFLLIGCFIFCCICSNAEVLNIRSASSATIYKPYLFSVNVVADVKGDWMITANASLTEGNAFILKRNNITFNYDVVYIYQYQIVAATTNGRWFAISDSNGTLVFQLDGSYNMINDQRLPLAGKFINLQLNEVLVLVSADSINSYQLIQGQWQSINSLVLPGTVPSRVNFLEDKMVIAMSLDTNNDQIYHFYQRNETSWYQIDQFVMSFLGNTKALAWNGNDTLIIFNQILVKQDSQWILQSQVATSDYFVRNAAFLDENSFITNEFAQSNSSTIFSRANSSDPWAPTGQVIDNLQRPNVNPLFQYFVTDNRVVVLSLDASSAPVRVFIDEIAEKCTTENTVIDCNIQLDTCQDVTITDYFTISRSCAVTIEPKPYPIRLQNVSGQITAGSFNFTTANGFLFSCDAIIQCPSSSNSPSISSTPPNSPASGPNGSTVTSPSASPVWQVALILVVAVIAV